MSFFLQFRVHINEQVTASDQVESGKGRVFDDVLLGKDQHVADAFVDAVGVAVGLGAEKARQSFRGDVGGNVGRIQATAGGDDCPAVNVGGEKLHHEVLFE